MLTCGLMLADLLPGGWWTASGATYIAFFGSLCFWQRLRQLFFGRSPVVFFDRMCINQQDASLKKQCIEGLPGFLHRSRRLVILWSPQTFSRLWCSFELAAFLKENGKARQVDIVPVSMAVLLWIALVVLIFLSLALQTWLFVEDVGAFGQTGHLMMVISSSIVAPVLIVGSSAQTYIGVQHMQHLLNLPGQIRSFDVRKARCTCCTQGHFDLQTGEQIICDRELILKTLTRWFGSGHDRDENVNKFNKLVHTELMSTVLENLGSGVPPLQYVLSMLAACCLGILPQYIRMGMTGSRVDPTQPYGKAWDFWQWTSYYFHVPSIVLFIFWLSVFGLRIGACLRRNLRMWQVVLLVFIMQLFFLTSFWLPLLFLSFPKTPTRVLGIISAMWAVDILLYSCLYLPRTKRSVT